VDWVLKEGSSLSRGMRDPRFLVELRDALDATLAGLERALREGFDDPEAVTRGLEALRAFRAAAEVLAEGLASPSGPAAPGAGTLRRIPVEAAPPRPQAPRPKRRPRGRREGTRSRGR
jgi:hypothetical protein